MAISHEAQREHDALFPNHKSILKVTDPEFIELFDNWAFGEVPSYGGLGIKTRLMVQLAAIIACESVNEYRVMMGGALNVGVTPVEIKEIVYQSVPYLGSRKSSISFTPPTRFLRPAALRSPCRPNPRPTLRRGSTGDFKYNESYSEIESSSSTRNPQRINCTYKSTCPPTVSATITPAPGWI